MIEQSASHLGPCAGYSGDAILALQRQINVLQLERDFELPATSHSTLENQQHEFKMELIRAYDTPTATQMLSHLTCMVSGVQMPREEIKAAHLFAKAKHVVRF